MSVFNYKKFKIALRSDTKKTQGLRVGDIVRRQYFDGTGTIYSLMLVLEIGTDQQEQSYFIGALLEGDEPQQDELLDFVRVTNLFDTDRSGALYLTANDSESPFMDVIDGIGRNESLCWPSGLVTSEDEDPQSKYVVATPSLVTSKYFDETDGNRRVLRLKRNETEGTVTVKQDFYKYVANPNRVLIAYKIKGTRSQSATASLEYIDGVKTDGEVSFNVTTEWVYQLHAITVDWSGRHLRSVKISLPNMLENDEVWIADLNIILLSSVAQFADNSQIRIGKLDGVTDPIFGKLNGYGSYLQKLYSSGSAHISGTLTAGDENGFGSTFYAGKIHRNVFVNSLSPAITPSVKVNNTLNPTGIGDIFKISESSTIIAQDGEWLQSHVGEKYTLSFWAYASKPCRIIVTQNRASIGTIIVESKDTHVWKRQSITFVLTASYLPSDSLQFIVSPTFSEEDADAISEDEDIIAEDTKVEYESSFLFTAPQLESGLVVSQYQATDDVLDDTEDYGAWFSRGGIGGTIQNPLLKLNFDNEGSIGTRTNSFLLKVDGSGYFANQNIRWDRFGNVTFGENVTLDWDNLSESAKDKIISKSVKITGDMEMLVIHSDSADGDIYNPSFLTLSLTPSNFELDDAQIQWQYKVGIQWVDIENATSPTLEVDKDSQLWDANESIELRVDVVVSDIHCMDTVFLKKRHTNGFRVEIESSQGTLFKNGECETVLAAKVYYRNVLVEDTSELTFTWHKYILPDLENEIEDWYQEVTDDDGNVVREAIDITASSITLDYELSGQEYFVVEVGTTDGFDYSFDFDF